MALKSANQAIRWLQRIGILVWTSGAAIFVREVLKSFFNFKTEEGALANGARVANTAARFGTYVAIDYGLWFVSIGIYTTAKTIGLSFFWIFVAIWVYEFIVAGAFIVFYTRTGEDLSLGVDFRRAMDTIQEKSRLAGYLAMAPIIVRAIVWTGPEKIVTFFRKEIGTVPRTIAVLLALTAIQALIWTVLYELGYGLVME